MFCIRVIGQFEIRPNGSGPLSRGAKEILAYLVLNGPSPRNRVAAALWPDSDDSLALYNLRRSLSDLRRNLGPEAHRLDTGDRGQIGFDFTDAEVDLFQMREALASGTYGEHPTLFHGVPLEGITGEWAGPFRDAIRTELTQGLVLAARNAAFMQEVGEAETLLRTALEHSGHKESIWQAMVRLYSEAGDIKTARKILAECESTLLKSGGREASWSAQDWLSEDAGRPSNLAPAPAMLDHLVGRREILAQLTGDLQTFRLVTLCGTGGMGKTRTAAALAHRIESSFSDGVAFVELAAASGTNQVREAIVRALGLQVEKGSPWTQAIEWLSRRQVLLILDNAEHLLSVVSEAVTELLAQTSRLRLLVTSRVPLGLPIERRRRLPSLGSLDAHELFAARASVANPDFAWSEAAEQLCDQLDGIPLAIELTAAQVGSISLAQLSENLSRSLMLDSACDGRPERHQTMRAALQLSFATLTPERRRAFVTLSVFAGGFTAAAAMAVAGVPMAELTRLTTASLIEIDGDRYRMLEPVRQLAEEELAHWGGEAKARENHARWFANAAKEAYREPFPYDLDPRGFAEERKRWQRDGANVRLALAHFDAAHQSISDDAFALWLVQIWYRLMDHSAPKAQKWLPLLLDAKDLAPLSLIAAHWHLTVGLYSVWNDQSVQAYRLLERLTESVAETGNLDVVAHAALAIGHLPVKDPLDGQKKLGYEVAVHVFGHLGADEQLRHAKVQLALYRSSEKSSAETWRELELLAQEALERNEVRTHVIALRSLANRETGWPERQAMLRDALRLQRSVGHWAEVHTLRSLGMSARKLGTVEDEIEAWKEAIQRGEEIGYMGTLAEAHLELARAYLRSGQEGQAWASMARCLTMIRAQDRPGFLHLAIAHLADLVRISGDEKSGSELLAYLRRAAARGLYVVPEKFEELHPGFSLNPDASGSRIFSSVADVIGWVEIRVALSSVGQSPHAAQLV